MLIERAACATGPAATAFPPASAATAASDPTVAAETANRAGRRERRERDLACIEPSISL
jgi:hypothetical protein